MIPHVGKGCSRKVLVHFCLLSFACAADSSSCDADGSVLLQTMSLAKAQTDPLLNVSQIAVNESTHSSHVDTSSSSALAAPLRAVLLWMAYSVAAAIFAWWKQSDCVEAAQAEREDHWDVCKAWFMTLVVQNHTFGGVWKLAGSLLFRWEMGGFALASGVMASSSFQQSSQTGMTTLPNSKLLRLTR